MTGSSRDSICPTPDGATSTAADPVAFTPGPWEAIKGVSPSDDLRCGVAAVRGDRSYLVATVENGAPGDCCDTEFANARLIAAAPELLSALKGAIGALEFSRDYHADLGNEDQAFAQDRLDAARAALQKALPSASSAEGVATGPAPGGPENPSQPKA